MTDYPSSPHLSSASAFEYDAFISYRTTMLPDALVGEELQKVLESYPIPKSLKQNIVKPKRFQSRLKIFRDTTDLSAGGNLNEAIKQRLRTSRWLIVICSPNTPLSTYCKDEARYFSEYHGNDRILYLLIKGEPHESFPLLTEERSKTSDASLNVQETLAADIRAADTKSIIEKFRGKRLPKEKQARFKLLAPILGCRSPDELIQRHRARIRRQIQLWFLVLFAFSWIVFAEIRNKTIRTEAEQLLANMGVEDLPSESEVDSLWQLAAEKEEVRLELLRQAITVHPRRFNKRAEMITRAAIGIDPAMAQTVKNEIFVPIVGSETDDPDEAKALIFLGLSLPISNPDFIVNAYKITLEQNNFFSADDILQENSSSRDERGVILSRPFAYKFWQRIRSLDNAESKETITRVLQIMKELKDPLPLSRSAFLLKELRVITPAELRMVTVDIIDAVNQQNDETAYKVNDVFLSPYLDMWNLMSDEFTEEDVTTYVSLIIRGMEASCCVPDLIKLRDNLIVLLNRTPPKLRSKAAPIILDIMKKGRYIEDLDEVLIKVPNLLTQEVRKQRVQVLLDLIDSGKTWVLTEKFATFSDDLTPNDMPRLSTIISRRLTNLITKISGLGFDDEYELKTLILEIVALPQPLPPSDYWNVADTIVKFVKSNRLNSGFFPLSNYKMISNAITKLSKPSEIDDDGTRVYADIIKQIESVDISKDLDRLYCWISILRAFGGELPSTSIERIRKHSLAKLATAIKSELLVVTNVLFAIGCDSKCVGRVVFQILENYETKSETKVLSVYSDSGLFSGLKEWSAGLSAADYKEVVRRILRFMNNNKFYSEDFLLLLEKLSNTKEDSKFATVKVNLLKEMEAMQNLSGVTKARVRCYLTGKKLSTLDIPSADLLSALRNQLYGQSKYKLDFADSDRIRILNTIIADMIDYWGRGSGAKYVRLLNSLPFTLNNEEKNKVADAVVKVFTKLTYEEQFWELNEFLSELQISINIDSLQSNQIVSSAIIKLKDVRDSSHAGWLVATVESLPITLSPTDAEQFTNNTLDIMKSPDEGWILYNWYDILGKINHQLSDQQRHAAASPAIAELQLMQAYLNKYDHSHLAWDRYVKIWLLALSKIPGGASLADQKQAQQLAFKILSSSPFTVENYFLENEEYFLEKSDFFDLVPGLDIKTLIELLKWPNLSAKSVDIILRKLENKSKESFNGDVWQATQWAKSIGLDVSSAPAIQN